VIAEALKQAVAARVSSGACTMIAAVDFDDEARLGSQEVNDEWANGNLAAKAHTEL
jgi:hypothetical protein